jgi:hypothetical protein
MQSRRLEEQMRIYMTVGLAMFAFLAAPVSAQVASRANVDRAYAALDQRTRANVETYLRTDCEIGELGVSLKGVLTVAAATRTYLTAVQQEGPPSPVLDEFGRGLEGGWQAREAYLRTPDAQELGKEAFDRMRGITKAAYVAEQQKGIQAKYRERAVVALKAMGTKPR